MRAQALAVVLGAAAGVLLALARGNEPPPPLAPVATRAEEAPAGTRLVPPQDPGAPAETAAATAPAPASAAPNSPPAASDAAATPTAPLLPIAPPLASPDELTASEIKCYQKDAEACRRAADAYDAGRIVPRDAERARTYRKVELTQLVRHCERDSPHACRVLAERYQLGDGVARSARQAAALVDRAKTLCQRHPDPTACAGLPPR